LPQDAADPAGRIECARFRLGVFLSLDSWGPGIEASRLAKVISALSLLLWLSVITAGRYIGFK
jgi:hypothetical protein